MRLLVYTCVFGDYDKVFPPVRPDPGIEYVAITDQADFDVPGWQTRFVDTTDFASVRLANRYYKILAHEVFADFDASIYVDGNIRVLGKIREFIRLFVESGAALGVYQHPERSTVSEEIAQCIKRGKITDGDAAWAELRDYRDQGFKDDAGLIEASILLRHHRHAELGPAMRLWWDLFNSYRSRDQFSLPFVLWKTKLPIVVFRETFRDPNPTFGWYPHAGAGSASAKYVEVAAKAHDSILYRGIRGLWHLKWRVQRLARRRADNV